MIHVGVDAWNLPGDRRGIGRYLRSILRAWNAHFSERVRCSLIVPEWHTWSMRSTYLREVEGAYPVISRAFHGRARCDVLWFPWNGCSWTNFTRPAVATLHDASNFVLAGYAPQTQRIFVEAAQRCSQLITDSAFSQHELARELRIAPDRLTPIALGVDPVKTTPRAPRVSSPYVLFVGQSERRKGIDTLLAAFARVREQIPEMQLVLAGPRGDAVHGPLPAGAIELGFVEDEELAALYAHASVFAFPSRYEGFGLPVLEAMSYGTPVVASNATAIPETAGDAAVLVPPLDDEALAHAIVRIHRQPELAAMLREAGLRRAAAFSWQRTAEATLGVLERAAR